MVEKYFNDNKIREVVKFEEKEVGESRGDADFYGEDVKRMWLGQQAGWFSSISLDKRRKVLFWSGLP